jgi:rhamnogalacturonan hydrolase
MCHDQGKSMIPFYQFAKLTFLQSPSHYVRAENVYCNYSGGSAFGSLGANTNISHIHYRNVYTIGSNQMMMIKSNGGNGIVTDVLFENFIGHNNAYSLDIDQHWGKRVVDSGAGVTLRSIAFRNWKGTCQDGARRSPIYIICADGNPCKDITIRDFAMWTEQGNSIHYTCQSAYGSGGCLKSGGGGAYAKTNSTINSPPAGYQAPRLPGDLRSGPAAKTAISIPAWPSSFYPGSKPLKTLAVQGGGSRPGPAAGPPPAKGGLPKAPEKKGATLRRRISTFIYALK